MGTTTTTGIYNIPERKKGDTSEKVIFKFSNKTTNLPIDLTGATAIMQFRFGGKNGQLVGDFSIGNGLSVPTPTNGFLELDQILKLPWAKGKYYYDIELLLADGRTKTYIKGVMPVVLTTSKPA